jgi:hypothetical protein
VNCIPRCPVSVTELRPESDSEMLVPRWFRLEGCWQVIVVDLLVRTVGAGGFEPPTSSVSRNAGATF